ncbi:MAG: hypothetical protein ACRDTZ_00100 [Pseudonocardiaceae bacterium]
MNGDGVPVTIVGVLTAIRTHLSDPALPEPWSVQVCPTLPDYQVSVQLRHHGMPSVAAGLVVWAATLTEVTARVWRTPDGQQVHLSIHGRLPCGLWVRVLGGAPSTTGIAGELPTNTSVDVPVESLQPLAGDSQ